jgi:metal-dependent hydrolase (beta-lactamase superfamily II)
MNVTRTALSDQVYIMVDFLHEQIEAGDEGEEYAAGGIHTICHYAGRVIADLLGRNSVDATTVMHCLDLWESTRLTEQQVHERLVKAYNEIRDHG